MPTTKKKKSKQVLGNCYEAAGKYMLEASIGNENFILVHAEVMGQGQLQGTTFGHAFVVDIAQNIVIDKSNGRNLELPSPLYFAIGNIYDIGNYFEYTRKQMLENMLKYETWGPWQLETASGL